MSKQRVFRVTDPSKRNLAYIAASTELGAKRAYAKSLEAEELSLEEIVNLTRNGTPIFDSEKGELIGDHDSEVPWAEEVKSDQLSLSGLEGG